MHSCFPQYTHPSLVPNRLKMVNAEVEEQFLKQTQWTVPDPDLQREVRQAVEQHVVPVFRDFFARYRCAPAQA